MKVIGPDDHKLRRDPAARRRIALGPTVSPGPRAQAIERLDGDQAYLSAAGVSTLLGRARVRPARLPKLACRSLRSAWTLHKRAVRTSVRYRFTRGSRRAQEVCASRSSMRKLTSSASRLHRIVDAPGRTASRRPMAGHSLFDGGDDRHSEAGSCRRRKIDPGIARSRVTE